MVSLAASLLLALGAHVLSPWVIRLSCSSSSPFDWAFLVLPLLALATSVGLSFPALRWETYFSRALVAAVAVAAGVVLNADAIFARAEPQCEYSLAPFLLFSSILSIAAGGVVLGVIKLVIPARGN